MAQSVDSDGGREPMAAMVAAAPFALALASLAFGLALLHAHPVMYWYDSYSRFFLRGQVIMARWLPLLQVVVFAVGNLTGTARSQPIHKTTGLCAGAGRLRSRFSLGG